MYRTDDIPTFVMVLVALGFLLIGFLLGAFITADGMIDAVNSGEKLFTDCHPITITQIVQDEPIEVERWWCRVGE